MFLKYLCFFYLPVTEGVSFSVPSVFVHNKTVNHTFDSFPTWHFSPFMVYILSGKRLKEKSSLIDIKDVIFWITTHKRKQCFFHPLLNDHNICSICFTTNKFVRQIMPLLESVDPTVGWHKTLYFKSKKFQASFLSKLSQWLEYWLHRLV